jgi:hypothetical protein
MGHRHAGQHRGPVRAWRSRRLVARGKEEHGAFIVVERESDEVRFTVFRANRDHIRRAHAPTPEEAHPEATEGRQFWHTCGAGDMCEVRVRYVHPEVREVWVRAMVKDRNDGYVLALVNPETPPQTENDPRYGERYYCAKTHAEDIRPYTPDQKPAEAPKPAPEPERIEEPPVYVNCALPLASLEAHEKCGACKAPAANHRGWVQTQESRKAVR